MPGGRNPLPHTMKTTTAPPSPLKIRPATALEIHARPHHAFVAYTDPAHPSLDGYGPTQDAAVANWRKVNPEPVSR